MRAAILLWAGSLVIYFLAREGAIALSALGENLPLVRYLLPRFLTDVETTGAVPIIVRSLFTEPWHWWLENVPWGPLSVSAGMALLYWLIGKLLLDCFETAMTPLGYHSVAFALGLGLTGVAFELPTLLGLLYRPAAIAVWAMLLSAAALARWWVQSGNLGQERAKRRKLALEFYGRHLLLPNTTRFAKAYSLTTWLSLSGISLLVLLHAIGLPETYWDSLILYMGYARKIFLQHAFPTKVVGQVGIGLGANYPHLYPLLTAQTATLAGHWHDVFAQLVPPLAGIASALLIYGLLEELTYDRLLAVSCALLFRAVPYGIAYFQYASDYALAILFTTAFLYCAAHYIQSGLQGPLVIMWLFAAFAVHINYLMWVLWPVALAATVLAHIRGGTCEMITSKSITQQATVRRPDDQAPDDETPFVSPHERAWRELHRSARMPLFAFLSSRRFLIILAISIAVASPWYLRNIIVTGNPVYAFFYNVFPSKNVNPAVMKSAELEWRLNGDGLGRVGRSLSEKLRNSWYYFVTGPHHWKLGPVFMALVMPGVLVFFGRLAVCWMRRYGRAPCRPHSFDDALKVGCVAAVLFFLLWFYAYAIADMYLYQIIIVLPLFAIFSGFVFELFPTSCSRTPLYALVLVIALVPGVTMSLMGFKLKRSSGPADVIQFSQITLTALRNLFIDSDTFYGMEFDGDMTMLRHVNALPPFTRLLTHENRHLLLNEDLQIIHLDDWEVQRAYHKPAAERVRILDSLGIQYYLYVPNEDKHRANSWLGMDELIGLGYFAEVFRTDSASASWREGLDYQQIPPDKNVLYRRTPKN